MDIVSQGAEFFISLFQAGGDYLMGLITGILPTLATLLVVVNAIVKFIGEDKLENFAAKGSKNIFIRYLILPSLSWFILTNPMAFTMARFLPEKYKASFFDMEVSIAHPFTGLFPHTNSGELFVWLGISQGLQTIGLPIGGLAVRYLIAGLIVGFLRAVLTERAWIFLAKRKGLEIDDEVALNV